MPRGRDYSWQVAAFVEGGEVTAPEPPAPEARFRVIEPSLLDETRRGLEACGDSHLLRGLLYARTGLLDEAERELGALVEANPGSAVAEELVRNVRALRPQSATPTTMKPAQ